MNRIAQFEKVSLKQFINDWIDTFGNQADDIITEIYNNINLPKRATMGSAGYDFFAPETICLAPNKTIKVATGIRVKIDEGWVLKIYPRSSLGFKYRLRLDNTVGIIDSDYYYAENEGHIFIKLTNCGDKELVVEKGKAFAQGVFVEYGITVDDECESIRTGGIGSTDKK